MKKAYVKPVFMAEEFVASTYHVSACSDRIDPNNKLGIYHGLNLGGNQNVDYEKGGLDDNYNATLTYWQYAGVHSADEATEGNTNAYLFTTRNHECDFLWDHWTDTLYVWNTPDTPNKRTEGDMYKADGTLNITRVGTGFKDVSSFFTGNSSEDVLKYEGTDIIVS